ncbi:peptidoglycan-binding domain-containing protein [Luteipulveratus halotolerans]|uniref:peptidoglycan-binding domain-containing protein n=1 Tax=Luteipulveratus halotolerans TaxID=1631356 RepID=UPI000680382E|nr:peptidoglycan-binding domain-containing protein [Luteipulveratus halotolerans]
MNHHITRRTLLAGTAAGSAAVVLGVAGAGAAHADDPAYPQLRLGSVESTYKPVRTVQYLLRRWVPSLAVDGSFGYGTQAAVKRFQSAERLPITGRLSTTTEWYRLLLRSRCATGHVATRWSRCRSS